MSIKCFIEIEEFAKKYYIKKFSKKYKNLWDISLKSIIQELERFSEFKKTNHVDLIVSDGDISVYKISFRIAKTEYSRKNSGNRYIMSLNTRENKIKILLMYNKNDIKAKNETTAWKKIIKTNYEGYDFLK